MTIKNLFLSLLLLATAACGDKPLNHNWDALEDYEKSKTFVPEYDREFQTQYYLDPNAVVFSGPKASTVYRGVEQSLEFRAGIQHPLVTGFDIVLDSPISGIKIENDPSDPLRWFLVVNTPEINNALDEIVDITITIVPHEDSDPTVLERLYTFYQLEHYIAFRLSQNNEGADQ